MPHRPDPRKPASRRPSGLGRAFLAITTAGLATLVGAVALAAPPASPGADVRPAAPQARDLAFPKGFLWGAATAAHQVEGGLDNDWKAFEAQPGNVRNNDTSATGVDHLRRYDGDFALARDMGHNAHRLSLEWSRLEPTRGAWDGEAVAHYHRVFAAMRKHGLKPLVTLHHFTNPAWLAARGGWHDPRAIEDFRRFAGFVGREFGHEVDGWITINEPNVYGYMAYQAGAWPPKGRDPQASLRVQANLVKGHAAAYHALHRFDRADADADGKACEVGVAQHVALYDPYWEASPLDRAQAGFSDDVFNRAFLRAVTTGEIRYWYPGVRGVWERHAPAAASVDFIGVNYYTRWRCASFGPAFRLPTPGAPTNAMGWEIYPAGIRRALGLANEYAALPDGRKVPLMVTENGIDDRDGAARSAYLVAHVREVAQAVASGLDVRGYMHWTLMDNFEWSEGYAPRFGLYAVDRRPGADLARIPTPAVATFRKIARANALPADLVTP